MGLDLRRVSFQEWIESIVWKPVIPKFINELEEKIGRKIPFESWIIADDDYSRVGSYTAYGIFCYCLSFLSRGDFEDELEPDEDIELEALKAFRDNLKPASVNLPFVNHFLDTNDADTIFLPIFFETPIEIYEIDISSLPAASKTLESFAEALSFDLLSEFDQEFIDEKWIPIATAKNIARIIYKFFNEKPNSCVAFS